ncbi:DNA-processing protein DprA [Microbacterium sp. NPDC077644]|uniref:DNA-processing protein DprA n=1 Tax=Microbacterium sp. NPDC077644 TaxID=3155055 RepID=UPI00344B585B
MDTINEITPQHPHWPAGLRDLNERMPQRLWVRGATAVLALPGVALVGARASTSVGNVNARQIADECGDAGFAIVSGLAYGVDAAAHSAAVSRRMPTVAYLAAGVDRVYPAAHHDLAQSIVDSGGALVSAYSPGSTPTRERFLERNGLIVTHSRAIAVVEAGFRSGTLNAARQAREAGRPVGAVPCSEEVAQHAGCNALIRDGHATPISSGAELLALIPQERG